MAAPQIVGALARSMIWNLSPNLVRQGFSGAAALRWFRDQGIRIRTADFYVIWGRARRRVEEEPYWRALPGRVYPGRGHYIPTHLALRGRYLYQGRIIGYDLQTGERVEAYYSFTSDRELKVATIRRRLWSLARIYEVVRGVRWESLELLPALRRAR